MNDESKTETGTERLHEAPDRLVALRHAMQGAEVPSVLFTWMQEVEQRLADLRSREFMRLIWENRPMIRYPHPFLSPEDFADPASATWTGYPRQERVPDEENPNAIRYDDGMDTSLVLTCGCLLRLRWDGPPRPPREGDYYACEKHSTRIGYDPDQGDPLYNRDQRVSRVIHDNECPASVPPPGMVAPGARLRVEQQIRVEQRPDEWLSIRTPGRVFEGRVLYVEEVPHPVNGDDHVAFKLPVPSGLPCSRAAVMLVALDDPVLPTMDEASAVRFEDDYPEEGET